MRPLSLEAVQSPVGTIYRAATPEHFALFYTGSEFEGRLNGAAADELSRTIETLTGTRAPLTSCHQVHGITVKTFRQSDGWCEESECDALWTDTRPSAIAIKVADCLPVTLVDPGARLVANIHSGWRGAAAKIVEATVSEVERHSNFAPSRSHVYLGPSIRQCCFEVGEEVVDAFQCAFGDLAGFIDRERGERPYLDLVGITGAALERLGFASGVIFDSGICTRCDERFHSYRRDRGRSGRNLAMAVLT